MIWNKTSESWPRIGMRVLIVQEGEIDFGEVGYSTMDQRGDEIVWKCYPAPTHWAPLPEKPKD